MSGSLPTGWTLTKLETLAGAGKYPIGDGDHGQIKPATYTDEGVPYIRVADMGWGKFEPNGLVYIPEKVHQKNLKSELRPGDIIIAKTGATIGKCCVIPDSIRKANTTSSVGKVTVNQNVTSPSWILYYFLSQHFKNQMWAVSNKTAQPGFNIRDLKRFDIPLAPFSEQRRIVKKIEKVTEKLEVSKKRLERIQILLKRLRQAILAAACSGRLTTDWRKGASSKTAKRTGSPADWMEVSVGDVIESLKYGTAQRCGHEKAGVPVLRIPNVARGKIDHSDMKFARLPRKELNQLGLRRGDILLVRSNGSVSLVGRTALVSQKEAGFAYAGYLIRLRPKCEVIEPAFLNTIFSTHDIRVQIELEARSTSGVNNLNGDEVRALKFRLPPMLEQREIVRRVKKMFRLVDQIEDRYKKARGQVQMLPQSILEKAFCGELVRQNPNDESARTLLERMIEDRTGNGSAQKSVKGRDYPALRR